MSSLFIPYLKKLAFDTSNESIAVTKYSSPLSISLPSTTKFPSTSPWSNFAFPFEEFSLIKTKPWDLKFSVGKKIHLSYQSRNFHDTLHHYSSLIYLSVGTCMCAMIGQFSRLSFTVQPTKFKSLFEIEIFPSIWTQRYNKYLLNLISWSVL